METELRLKARFFDDHSEGRQRFDPRWWLLYSLDDSLRLNAPNGAAMRDYDKSHQNAELK